MARGGARKGAGRPQGSQQSWSKDAIDRFRARIQTEAIIQRLNKIACGEIPGDSPAISAALGLLRKVVPDLTAVEHSGEVSVPTVMRIPAVAENTQAWQKQHVPAPNKTLQ